MRICLLPILSRLLSCTPLLTRTTQKPQFGIESAYNRVMHP